MAKITKKKKNRNKGGVAFVMWLLRRHHVGVSAMGLVLIDSSRVSCRCFSALVFPSWVLARFVHLHLCEDELRSLDTAIAQSVAAFLGLLPVWPDCPRHSGRSWAGAPPECGLWTFTDARRVFFFIGGVGQSLQNRPESNPYLLSCASVAALSRSRSGLA